MGLTPAANEVTCLTGVQAGFEEAATKSLPKICGLRLSESTVRRATEQTGQRLGERLAANETFGDAAPWAWHRDAEGKTCAYVTADATGVPQQGPHGEKADGRMAWVLSIYNPLPDQVAWRNPKANGPARMQARYLAGLGPLVGMGETFRTQAAHVGMDQAERWIALSDGGTGLEPFLQKNFGRLEAVVLDFCHVAQRLNDLARLIHVADETKAKSLAESWCHQLKHEGGQALLQTLEGLSQEGWSSAAKANWREQVQYIRNHVHRMDYPQYQAKGWQIGSGPVESACKRVVNQRLKGSGMRWREEGTDSVCHLRALFLSTDKQWDAFWNSNAA